ncbi:MAG: hypothetical protein KGY61_14170 [Desulfobacterales bacterium]|nr:hypothetical protein [Desulfobacterales bacterium]
MKKWKMILLMVLISGFLTLPAFSAEDTGVSDEKVLPEASASEEVPKTSASENMQSPAVHQQALMEEANSLLKSQEVDKIKQAIPIYEKILKNDPDNYEATWRCAKAYRDYGYRSRLKELSGWEDTCAKYGKKGMKRAKKAIKLNPERAEGYYVYGLSVGVYSNGVGIITALKEGLRTKTKNNLEKAYKIDKSFDKGGPILALGRYYQKVPWPWHDEDKAMQYFRELEGKPYYGGHVEHYIYPAEILMDQWGGEPKREARSLLKKAIKNTDSPFWKKHIRQLLEDL